MAHGLLRLFYFALTPSPALLGGGFFYARELVVRHPKRVTRQQDKIARARVKHPNSTHSEIGRLVGVKDRRHVKRTLDKPHVQERIRKLMDACPETALPGLHKILKEGLAADETKFFANEGEVVSERIVVDFGTRHRYLETALEMQGLKRTKLDVTSNGQTVKALLLDD